jgi:hypothetical protein
MPRLRPWIPIILLACTLAPSIVTAAVLGPMYVGGHWEGKRTCKSSFFGAPTGTTSKTTSKLDVTVEISQGGYDLNLQVFGNIKFNGRLIPDPKNPDKKGEIAIVLCGSSSSFVSPTNLALTGRGTVSEKSLKILSIQSSGLADGTGGSLICKWTLKRIDLNDPGVPNCP